LIPRQTKNDVNIDIVFYFKQPDEIPAGG